MISAIRLHALLIFGNSIDPSWDYVFVVIWTALELGVAIIAACLPALRSLCLSLLPDNFTFSTFLASGAFPAQQGKRKGDISAGWKGKGGFVEIEDVTEVGSEQAWRREKNAHAQVPMKIIERDRDGKFRSSF